MLHQEWILMELKVEYRFDGNKCVFRITQTILAMQLPKYFFFPFLYLGNWRHCQMFERPKNSLLLPRYHSCQRQRPDACIFCWSYRWPLYKQRRGIWFHRYIYYYCYQVCIMFLGNKILTYVFRSSHQRPLNMFCSETKAAEVIHNNQIWKYVATIDTSVTT